MQWPTEQFLLTTQRLPFRLSMEDGGLLLGFLPHEMSILWREGLLKSALLGNPSANGHKYLSRNALIKLGEDDAWLNKATKTIQRSWQNKNSKSAEDLAA